MMQAQGRLRASYAMSMLVVLGLHLRGAWAGDELVGRSLECVGLSGLCMLATTAEEPMWIFAPRREEGVEAKKRKEAAFGWWSLHGLATAGLARLPANVRLDNGDALDEVALAMFHAFGVRTTFSLTSWLLVEGDAVYMSTGQAVFQDVNVEGAPAGNFMRSARLGRMQSGLLLRLASTVISPIVRGGLGVQGAFYDAEVDGEAVGPGNGFERSALWYFGAGLIAPLGRRCTLGFGGSYAAGIESNEQSFGMSLDLGCAWKLGGR